MKKINEAYQILLDVYARHNDVVLFFSAGKDSLATLRLVLDLDLGQSTTLLHVNQGDEFPEITECVERCGKLVKNLEIAKGDVLSFTKFMGWPTDLPVTDNTDVGKRMFNVPCGIKAIDKYACCKHNKWDVWENWIATHDVSVFVSGSKDPDMYGHTANGTVVNGKVIEICNPIRSWTDEDVLSYLKEKDFMFGQEERLYLDMDTSLDCRCCTAHWEHAASRLAYLRKHHPKLAQIIADRYGILRDDAKKRIAIIDEALRR